MNYFKTTHYLGKKKRTYNGTFIEIREANISLWRRGGRGQGRGRERRRKGRREGGRGGGGYKDDGEREERKRNRRGGEKGGGK